MEELKVNITGYKRIYFGDWIIVVTNTFGCLYNTKAYNAITDTTILNNSTYVLEIDAFNSMINKIKTLSPVLLR